MVVDPRTISVAPVPQVRGIEYQANPSFGQVVGATQAQYFDAPFSTLLRSIGNEPDPDFDIMSSIRSDEDPNMFIGAQSYADIVSMREQNQRAIDRDLLFSRASLGQVLAAEFTVPLNAVAFGVAAPARTLRAGTLAGLRSGASEAATIVGAYEFGVLQTTDYTHTMTESLANTAMALTFGGVVGGASGALRSGGQILSQQAARNIFGNQSLRDTLEASRVIAASARYLGPTEWSQFAARDSRTVITGRTQEGPFIRTADQIDDEFLLYIVNAGDRRVMRLQQRLQQVRQGTPEHRGIQRAIDQAESDVAPARIEQQVRRLEELGVDVTDPFRPAAGGESPLLAILPTPMRRVLGATDVPSGVKSKFVELSGDNAVLFQLNALIGRATPQSVYLRAQSDLGRVRRLHVDMEQQWQQATGASPRQAFDINFENVRRRVTGDGLTFDEWSIEVNRKYVTGEAPSNPFERSAMDSLRTYYGEQRLRLQDVGLLQTTARLEGRLASAEGQVRKLEATLRQARAGAIDLSSDAEMNILGSIPDLKAEISRMQDELYFQRSLNESDDYLNRAWNRDAIRQDREGFIGILMNWYRENPTIMRWVEEPDGTKKLTSVELSTDDASLRGRAERTASTILDELDDMSIDVTYGPARPGSLAYRALDIPNRLVWDYMEQNPLALTRMYAQRTNSQFRFREQFGGSISDVVETIRRDMKKAGASTDRINEVTKEFQALYDRVAGSVIKNPDALNQRTAFALRSLTSLAYLGKAGIAAMGDFGRVIAGHKLTNIGEATGAMFNPRVLAMFKQELQAAGLLLENAMNLHHLQLHEGVNSRLTVSPAADRWLNNANLIFYNASGLTPVTMLARTIAGMSTSKELIQVAGRIADGTADEFDTQYFLRHGLTIEDAAEIQRMPWQTDAETGLILPNTDAWRDAYLLPEVNGQRVSVSDFEATGMRSGSGKGKFIRYDARRNVVHMDREYIEDVLFRSEALTNPQRRGVDPLPNALFRTPQDYTNFYMLREIARAEFTPASLKVKPSSPEYINRLNRIALERHQASVRSNEELVTRFRSALYSDVFNTVMSASPADKPIIYDGIVHIPMSVAGRFGFTENPRTPGYARIENGFLAMPFQFYSYAFANVNKTVGMALQGTLRNRVVGASSMLALGYLITQIRTPDFVWEEMSMRDRMMRAFDMGGLAALYSDIMYTSIETSLALGGPNPTFGVIQPRYTAGYDPVGAVTGLTGASTAWTASMIESMGLFMQGDYQNGGHMFINNLPFQNLWFIDSEVNHLARGIRGDIPFTRQ